MNDKKYEFGKITDDNQKDHFKFSASKSSKPVQEKVDPRFFGDKNQQTSEPSQQSQPSHTKPTLESIISQPIENSKPEPVAQKTEKDKLRDQYQDIIKALNEKEQNKKATKKDSLKNFEAPNYQSLDDTPDYFEFKPSKQKPVIRYEVKPEPQPEPVQEAPAKPTREELKQEKEVKKLAEQRAREEEKARKEAEALAAKKAKEEAKLAKKQPKEEPKLEVVPEPTPVNEPVVEQQPEISDLDQFKSREELIKEYLLVDEPVQEEPKVETKKPKEEKAKKVEPAQPLNSSDNYLYQIVKDEKSNLQEFQQKPISDIVRQSYIEKMKESNDIKHLTINKVSDKSGELVISDADILNKYKDLNSFSFSDEDWKRIYLDVISVNGNDDNLESRFFNNIKIVKEYTNNSISADIEATAEQISTAIKNLKSLKQFTKKDIKQYKDNLVDRLELADDVVFNVKYEWFSKQLKDDDINYKTWFKAPDFNNNKINLVEQKIIKSFGIEKFVLREMESLRNPINSIRAIQEHVNKLSFIIEYYLIKADNKVLFKDEAETIKNILCYLWKELCITLNLSADELIKIDPKWIKKSNQEKLLSFVKQIESTANQQIKQIQNVTKYNGLHLIQVADQFIKVFLESSNKTIDKLIHSDKNNVLANKLQYIRDQQSLFVRNAENAKWLVQFFVSPTTKTINLVNLDSAAKRSLKITKEQYENLYSELTSLDIPLLKTEFAKAEGLLILNKLLNKFFVFLNVSILTLFDQTELVDADLSSSADKRAKKDSKTIAHIRETINTIDKILSKVDVRRQKSAYKYTEQALEQLCNLGDIIKSLKSTVESRVDVYKEIAAEIIKPTKDILSQLLIVIKMTTVAVKQTKRAKSLPEEVMRNLRIIEANDVDFGDLDSAKTLCKICNQYHFKEIAKTRILANTQKYPAFKKYVKVKMNDILKNHIYDFDSYSLKTIVFNKLVTYKIIQRGILSSLIKIVKLIEAQLTDKYIHLILNEVNPDEHDKARVSAKLYFETLQANSIKLFLLKCINQENQLLLGIENEMAKNVPELAVPSKWDDAIQSRIDIATESIEQLFKNKEEDKIIDYFYCEFVKEGLIKPSKVTTTKPAVVEPEKVEEKPQVQPEEQTQPIEYTFGQIDEEEQEDYINYDEEPVDEEEQEEILPMILEPETIVIEGEDVVVSEFFVEKDPTKKCDYKEAIDETTVTVVEKVKFVNIQEFEKYKQIEEIVQAQEEAKKDGTSKNKTTFKDILQKQKSRAIYKVSVDDLYYIKDSWNLQDFINK